MTQIPSMRLTRAGKGTTVCRTRKTRKDVEAFLVHIGIQPSAASGVNASGRLLAVGGNPYLGITSGLSLSRQVSGMMTSPACHLIGQR